MAIKLFGFQLLRNGKSSADEEQLPSVVTPQVEDGSINIQSGSHYGIYVDIDGTYRTEVDLITKYRTMAMQPEIESAIEDIINESIVHDTRGQTVSIVMDELKQPDRIKKLIREEFDEVLRMLDFSNFGSDVFRRWYIDGRLYYNVVIDMENPRAGIRQLIYIDPRRIRKVRQIKKKREGGVEVVDKIENFYIYNERVVNNNIQNPQITGSYAGGTRLTEDSVVYITSGLYDPAKSTVLSYVHKAIRPMNQLRFVEDATVIYRVSRAPERRVFYVDVGNMPRQKAEQYLRDTMTKFRNKLTYDSATGEIKDDRRQLSMLEDFWMPRRGEGKSTEITTLPAGQNLGQMDDVKYFEQKLYKALNVPVSRLEPQQGFSLGRSNEVTRDELKFDKFIDKLRARFSILFDEIMARQLSLKGICTLDEWESFKQYIHYDFIKDNNFVELKEAELLQNRVNTLNVIQPYVGQYFSKKWVLKNVLYLDEEDIVQMQQEIEEEAEEQMQQEQQAAMAQAQAGGEQQDANTAPKQQTQQPEDINSKVSQLLKGNQQ